MKQQYQPIPVTKASAAVGICSRIDCQNPTVGGRRYCSDRCSKLTRNRRYYDTPKGRKNKREAARRYFQAHRNDLYARRRERFERLFEHYSDNARKARTQLEEEGRHDPAMKERIAILTEDYCDSAIRRLIRLRHDHHPEPRDMRHGSDSCWESRHPELASVRSKRG